MIENMGLKGAGMIEIKKAFRKDIGKKNAWIVLLTPSLAGISVFILIPFLDVVRRSFTAAITGRFTGLSNYRLLLTTPAFLLAVKNTVRFTVVCLPLLILTGLIIALLLSRLKYMQLLKSMLLFPLAVPTATVVLIWKMVFYKQGFLNIFLQNAGNAFGMQLNLTGATAPDYMGTGMAFWVLVFSYIWKNLGYTVILWLAGIMGISTDITEAARVDGAGKWKSFIKVTMPNLKGTLYTITVLSFLNSFKVFREAYLVAGAYPDKSMYLLQHLFNNWFVKMDFDKMAAAAVCVGAVLFIAIMLLQKAWDGKQFGK